MSIHAPSAPGDRAMDVGSQLDPGGRLALVGSGILELRKEKSRDAARSRRGKENYEFYELAKLLPLPAAITSQLDKASIIRLSISYLKLQEFSAHGDPPWSREFHSANGKSAKGQGRRRNANIIIDLFENHQGTHILQSLDGFAFALSNDGRFLYISETVSIYLGLSQVEVTGSSIFDYVHTQDHQELAEQLGLGFPHNSPGSVPSPNAPSDDGSQPSTPRVITPPSPEKSSLMFSSVDKGQQRTFCMRMKSTLTKRGVHVRTSGYRVVYIVGQLRTQICFSLNRKQPQQILGLVGVAIALPPPTITELRIEKDTFILRLSPAFKVLYCDTAISEITDWSCDDLNNKALYDFCHPGDLNKLRKSHLDITNKGQVLSEFFRLINKCGGYLWVQMCGTTLYSSKTSDDHTILAIIYVLSGVEYRGCVMDNGQLTTTQHTETDHSDNTDQSEQGSDHGGNSKDDTARNSKSPGDRDDRDSTGLMGVSSQPPGSLKRTVSMIEHDLQGSNCHSLQNQDKNFMSSNSSMQIDTLYSRNSEQQEKSSPVITNSNEKVTAFRHEFKYSRRKNERPRKRRREFEIECCTEDEFPTSSSARLEVDSCGEAGCDINSVSHRHRSNGRSSASSSPDSYVSALPQDLSLNSFNIQQVPVSSSPAAVSSCETRSVMQNNCWQNGSIKEREDNSGVTSSTSSVKDLEDVMNKHLPHISNHIEAGLKGSSDLRHLSPGNMQKSRSTVQWRGTGSENDALPASNLLRTLYANRESVIRSNTRPQCFNGDNSSSGVNSVDMLTPPGNDGGLKEQLTLNIPQITVSGKTVSAYNNPLSVSVQSSLRDTFSITPPSSVSPEDKVTAPFVDGNYNLTPCNMTPTNSLANPIPVKSPTFSISLPTQVSALPDYNTCSNKINYSNMAAYNMAEYQQYVHSGNQGSVIMYDARPESWYPISYPS